MEIFIVVIILSALSIGSAFTQPNNLSYDARRLINNATAFPHVEAARHGQLRTKIDETNIISFSEMNEHERAIIAHSSTNNSTSHAYQRMIEGYKKKLNKSETNIASSSFSELNAGDKTALVHEHVSSAGVEAYQIQVGNLHGLHENKKWLAECVRLSYDPSVSRKEHRTGR